MNIKKTKVMMCSKLRGHSITVQGIDIEEVDSYNYLKEYPSQMIQQERSKEDSNIGWVKFGNLGFIFRYQELPDLCILVMVLDV